MEQLTTSRRAFLHGLAFTAALAGSHGAGLGRPGTVGAAQAGSVSPEEALQRLLEGNARFVSGTPLGPRRSPERRAEVARGQAPYAAILACADSRVPPELVFDAGLGDLFVVRVAGNLVDEAGLASLEFAAASLGAPLLFVLGHQRCGAVDAAVAVVTQGARLDGHLPTLAAAIRPAVERARGQPGDLLENAIRANIALAVEQLAGSPPVLAPLVAQGAVRVVGGYYALDSGQVTLIA